MKCPRCQHESPPPAKFCPECGTPLLGADATQQSYADLKRDIGRLTGELEGLRRSLGEAFEQQAAASEILRVIRSSPTDVQPVFDAIVASSVRLCAAKFGVLFRFDGDMLSFVAHHNLDPAALRAYQSMWPRRPELTQLTGTAILERRVLHVHDVESESRYTLAASWRDVVPIRTCVVVPILRSGEPIGVIALYRDEVAPFSDRQIDLVKTFADQAVIAIENVRLFTELQQKNRALTEALDQQTATSEILGVISGSPTDVLPVFDAIGDSAVRLTGAHFGAVMLFDGEALSLAAVRPVGLTFEQEFRDTFPARGDALEPVNSLIRTGGIRHIADIETEDAVPEASRRRARLIGYRGLLQVPMLKDGRVIGVLGVSRREPGRFSDAEIALLQTFADQAVIAIENVRLFKELEARNRDLTATSEILQVIARSPTDLQPVFDTIARNARRLCGADSGGVVRLEGTRLHSEALDNTTAEIADAMRQAFPTPVDHGTASGRAILTKRQILIPDVLDDPDYEFGGLKRAGLRSVLCVPMLRHGAAIGCIVVHTWATPRPFTDAQIDLLQTFADQAVIAIENVRLFRELQARNRDLTATSGIL